MASPPDDFFVELTENRLQQSLARLNSADNRALGLLGFIAVLLTALWTINIGRGSVLSGGHLRASLATGCLVLALITAGISLLLTAQYDSPNLETLYEKYFAETDLLYPKYFASAFQAIALNGMTAQLKSWWLLGSTMAIFLAVLVLVV